MGAINSAARSCQGRAGRWGGAVLEGHLVVIRGADAEPGAFDDGARELAEVRSPMDAALDGDEALGARVDAEHAQHVDRGRLHMLGKEHDLDPSSVEDHRRAKHRLDATVRGRAAREGADRDRLHRRFDLERRVRPAERWQSGLAADRKLHARADARRDGLLHRLRIIDAEEGDILELLAQDSASTAVVSIVPPEAQLS